MTTQWEMQFAEPGRNSTRSGTRSPLPSLPSPSLSHRPDDMVMVTVHIDVRTGY